MGDLKPERSPEGCPLFPREWESLRLLAEGLTYKQIAHRRGRATTTIRSQLHAAFGRLGVRNAQQAIAEAYRRGWMFALPAAPEPEDEDPLTPGQRLYLQAFDRLLLAKSEPAKASARAEMRHMLGAMCIERQIPVPAGGQQRKLKNELPR